MGEVMCKLDYSRDESFGFGSDRLCMLFPTAEEAKMSKLYHGEDEQWYGPEDWEERCRRAKEDSKRITESD